MDGFPDEITDETFGGIHEDTPDNITAEGIPKEASPGGILEEINKPRKKYFGAAHKKYIMDEYLKKLLVIFQK